MKAESEEASSWVEIVLGLEPLVRQCPDFSLFVMVRKPFWRRSSYRSNCLLPISRIEFSQNTWELCVHSPGLLKENDVGDKTLSLLEFHQQLSAFVEGASHCTLVLSDERTLALSDLSEIVDREGEWSGPPIDELEDEELVARLDLPILEMAFRVLAKKQIVQLRLKC